MNTRNDYQAQTITECLSTWCTLTAGHEGTHTDRRERDELAATISTNLDGIFGTRDFGPATQDFRLADALIAAGYGKLADAWDEGSQAGWSDRTRSIMGRYTHEQEIANETPNPYRSAAK